MRERKGEGKNKNKGKPEKEKGEGKGKSKSNSGKGNGGLWNEQSEQRWNVDTVGNGTTRKLNEIKGKDDVQWNLVQWYRTRHILLFLTLDLLCIATHPSGENSSLLPLVCWSIIAVEDDEDWPEEWCYEWESDWMEDWREDWSWHNAEEYMSDGTMMKVPIWCGESSAQIQI